MRILFKLKDGNSDIMDTDTIELETLNPCSRCRKGGGCYDHACFADEDWGHFLYGGEKSIKLENVDTALILEL